MQREQVRSASVAAGSPPVGLVETRPDDAVRSALLAAAAHDAKAPLAVIAATVEMLLSDRGRVRDATALLDRSLEAVRQVARMLDDLVAIDRSLEEASPVVVIADETLEELVWRIGRSTLGSSHPYRCEFRGTAVVFDAARLSRVLENILRNAACHTPPGTQVVIEIEAREDGVLLSVDDGGPGNAPAVRAALSNPVALEGRRSGIGLGILRRLVESAGGRIWVVEPAGGGTGVRVWLPAPEGRPAVRDDL